VKLNKRRPIIGKKETQNSKGDTKKQKGTLSKEPSPLNASVVKEGISGGGVRRGGIRMDSYSCLMEGGRFLQEESTRRRGTGLKFTMKSAEQN